MVYGSKANKFLIKKKIKKKTFIKKSASRSFEKFLKNCQKSELADFTKPQNSIKANKSKDFSNEREW